MFCRGSYVLIKLLPYPEPISGCNFYYQEYEPLLSLDEENNWYVVVVEGLNESYTTQDKNTVDFDKEEILYACNYKSTAQQQISKITEYKEK